MSKTVYQEVHGQTQMKTDAVNTLAKAVESADGRAGI